MTDGDPALEDDGGALEYQILGIAMPGYGARIKSMIERRRYMVDELQDHVCRSVNTPPNECRAPFRAAIRRAVKDACAAERRRLERAEKWLTLQPIKAAGAKIVDMLNGKSAPLSGIDENFNAIGEQAERLIKEMARCPLSDDSRERMAFQSDCSAHTSGRCPLPVSECPLWESEEKGSFQVTENCGESSVDGGNVCYLPKDHGGLCGEGYCDRPTAVGGRCTFPKGHQWFPCSDGRRRVSAAEDAFADGVPHEQFNDDNVVVTEAGELEPLEILGQAHCSLHDYFCPGCGFCEVMATGADEKLYDAEADEAHNAAADRMREEEEARAVQRERAAGEDILGRSCGHEYIMADCDDCAPWAGAEAQKIDVCHLIFCPDCTICVGAKAAALRASKPCGCGGHDSGYAHNADCKGFQIGEYQDHLRKIEAGKR